MQPGLSSYKGNPQPVTQIVMPSGSDAWGSDNTGLKLFASNFQYR